MTPLQWKSVSVQKILGGIYSVGDEGMLQAKRVAKVDALEFAPQACLQWEWARSP